MYGYNPSGNPSANVGDVRPLTLDANGRPATLMVMSTRHTQRALSTDMPTKDRILEVLRSVNWSASPVGVPLPESLANQPPIPTQWVGPVPRIVRRTLGLGVNKETDVAWVLQLTPPPGTTDSQIGAAQQNRKLLIERALGEITGVPGDWSGATLVAYSPALHGPLSFWQSGQAGRTMTSERYPAVGEPDLQESPVSPNASDLEHPDYLTWLNRNLPGGGAGGGFSWGLLLGGVVVAGGLLYAISKSSGREVVIRTEGRGERST